MKKVTILLSESYVQDYLDNALKVDNAIKNTDNPENENIGKDVFMKMVQHLSMVSLKNFLEDKEEVCLDPSKITNSKGADLANHLIVDAAGLILEGTAIVNHENNYKTRMVAEYQQLKGRRNKLYNMLQKWDEGKLDFTPSCPRELLQKQLDVMDDYLGILIDRAVIEKVDLDA
jgi:hypothetical protein